MFKCFENVSQSETSCKVFDKANKMCSRHLKVQYFCYSYKEESGTETDSEDVLEWKENAKETVKNDAETIERVLKTRLGKKGGK